MDTFELSEITPKLLANAYAYYCRGRFSKYIFSDWLLKECIAVRDANGNLVDLKRLATGKYAYGYDYMLSFAADNDFITLFSKSMVKFAKNSI